MSNPENTLEHHVAMDVTDLTSAVATLILRQRDETARELLALDRDTLVDAHTQLGRVIARLPIVHRIAAE